MRFYTRRRHIIDLVFPIALFFVFAASTLAVLLLSANLYRSVTAQIEANDTNRTCLSYISQKMRQTDSMGGASIVQIDGQDCLALPADYEGTPCTTYIYEYDGMLTELFIKDGITVSLNTGNPLIAIESLTMEETDEGLFHFTSRDTEGILDSIYVLERSRP